VNVSIGKMTEFCEKGTESSGSLNAGNFLIG
jgi:hypothetical protein